MTISTRPLWATRPLGALAILGLAAAAVVTTQSAASADLVTHCTGEADGVTVPGDLLVPADSSCVLQEVTITGDVQVEAGANLVLAGSAIAGDVQVAADGYVDAEGGSVAGDITSQGYGIWLDGTQAASVTVAEPSAEESAPFLYADAAELDGAIEVAAGDVYLVSTRVTGDVVTTGTTYTDVIDSTLLASLTVGASSFGTAVCDSEIDGNTHLHENAGPVHLGSGLIAECSGMSYFGSDLVVEGNTAGVVVRDAIVRGDLGGEGNDPAPHGQDNRVRGEQSGQFADLEPAPEADTLTREAGPADSGERLQGARADRHQEALEQAEEIGAASL
ncbi:hypothetical protein [Ruania zhangjianzhongii]|uniref:hypothetical protein n=1 Tax=Ruania zhangjianzhongii TaxID=2603206 RepID=UPI0011CC8F23|nr:hypothetical protein [Ruania zhangjianzhongii]